MLAVFYARPLRRSGLETIPQYLTIPYGRSAGPLASLVSSLGILFSAVASALAGIHLMVAMFGLAPWLAAAVLVLLVIAYGLFINTILEFAIIAFAVFILVRQINRLRTAVGLVPTPTEKACPYCLTNVPLAAKKCKACASELPA